MSDEKPRYRQNRRLKQARLQRRVRNRQRLINQFRVFCKLFLIAGIFALIFFLLKSPQWRLKSDAFGSLESPALEVVNNHIVPEQKILSALRRNQVPKQPLFM